MARLIGNTLASFTLVFFACGGTVDAASNIASKLYARMTGDESIAGKHCIRKVLSGLDNLLGVCNTRKDIQRCAAHRNPSKKCRKVRGPGGNLVTQDITEDVRLGANTPANTAKWHAAFTKCASDGTGCAEAADLYRPVLLSVQEGLAKLVASPQCKTAGLDKWQLATSDFVDCGKDGVPTSSTNLFAIAQHIRTSLPERCLARFPLHGVTEWTEPSLRLPREVDDEDEACQ